MSQDLIPTAARGKNVSVQELVNFIGIVYESVRQDIKAGCPIVREGRVGGEAAILNTYEWWCWKLARTRAERKSVATLIGGTVSATGDAKQRILEASAGKREAELAKMNGELFPMADFDTFIADEMVSLRTALLGIEDELRDEFGDDIASRVQNIVIQHVNMAVEGLQNIPENIKEVA